MLVKLLPDQISKHWPTIKLGMDNSLPPTVAGSDEDRGNNMLRALLTDRAQCWISNENGTGVNGMLITTISQDKVSGTKSLLIYCLYAFGKTYKETWVEGFETIKRFAKGEGCHRIVGYTAEPKIREIVDKLGGSTKYTFVSLEV